VRTPSLPRRALGAALRAALRDSPVVALLGPRQCGKTTLARQVAGRRAFYFDLEDPADAARLEQPASALAPLRGLAVIDEVQRAPQLLPVLRVLADRKPAPARFLLLGSAAPELVRRASETLAGRIAFVDMGGFTLDEVGAGSLRRLWLRGGFPRSFLARGEAASLRWREHFVRTFLERDVREFGFAVPSARLRRFWMMLAHYHGGIWNGSEIGRSLGLAHTTVRHHLDILEGAMMVRVLHPWHENLAKRQLKSPKVYLRDSGLLHALLAIADWRALERHPKLGASWEGFVLEQLLARTGGRNAYYWATQGGAELDLLLFGRGGRIGVEIKYADAPRFTRSAAAALADLALDRLFVVHPGDARYALAPRAEAIGLAALLGELRVR
jgi:predicted AAA+ superfamily ATPase